VRERCGLNGICKGRVGQCLLKWYVLLCHFILESFLKITILIVYMEEKEAGQNRVVAVKVGLLYDGGWEAELWESTGDGRFLYVSKMIWI
jgi:hypothetical protein